jgi:hypothetical protein
MDDMSLSRTHTWLLDGLFYIRWVAANSAAIFLGAGILYAMIFLAKAIQPGINEDRFFGVLLFPLLASMLGIFQWYILRPRLPKARWWVLATAAGMLIGVAACSAAAQAVIRLTGQSLNWGSRPALLAVFAIIGLGIALAQLPLLRRYGAATLFWLPITMLGWVALGLAMGPSIDRTSDIFAFGAIPGAVTGLGLVWLLRRPRR